MQHPDLWTGLGKSRVQADCHGSDRDLHAIQESECFHENILVFQVILALKSWEVFREIYFSHLPVGKRMNCMYSFPSLNVSILKSTQSLNWFLSFNLLSSSEEHF